jgi:hypothetical protein
MNPRIKRKVTEYKRRFPQIKDLVVEESSRKGKRLTATFTQKGEKKTVHFGQDTAFTWADGADAKKRASYQARASKITNAKGEYTYRIPGTANSLAYWILW